MKIDLDARQPFPNHSTSITDISFLLTIFFIISAVFIADMGIFLSLPRGDSAPRLLAPEEAIAIRIGAAADGGGWQVVLEKAPTPMEGLAAAVRALLPGKRSPVAVIRVDRGVPYQEVLDVVSAVKEAGVDTFSMGVESR
jgi:biopolymer transport protein ExbD